MAKIARLSLILLIITMVSAALLGVTNDITKVIIQEKAMEANLAYMKEILTDADEFKVVEDPGVETIDAVEEAYEALKGGSIIGYVVKTVTSGYGGDVVQLTGINSDGTIAGVRVASQGETPGLGAKIADEDFTNKFIGKSTDTQLSVVKGAGGEDTIESISGATISSNAATNGVNAAMKLYEDVLK